MSTNETPEKISTVGSTPSGEAVPPQTHHCGWDVSLHKEACRVPISMHPPIQPDLQGEFTLPIPPSISLADAMQKAEDRRSANLTATMINQAIGLTLLSLGHTKITLSEKQIMDFAKHNRVAMSQDHREGNFTVTVIPRVPE